MSDSKRKTKVISISLNEYTLDRAKSLVEANKFGSISDLMSTALIEFLDSYDTRQFEVEKQVRDNISHAVCNYLEKSEINFSKVVKDTIENDPEVNDMILDIIRKQMFPEKTNTSKTKKQESKADSDNESNSSDKKIKIPRRQTFIETDG